MLEGGLKVNGHVSLTLNRNWQFCGFKEKGSESRCLDVASKRVRQVMMRLSGGTAPLRIESRRWQGLPRERYMFVSSSMWYTM